MCPAGFGDDVVLERCNTTSCYGNTSYFCVAETPGNIQPSEECQLACLSQGKFRVSGTQSSENEIQGSSLPPFKVVTLYVSTPFDL